MATINAISVALFNAAAGGYAAEMEKNGAAFANAVGPVLEKDISTDALFVEHLLGNLGVTSTSAVYAQAKAAVAGLVTAKGRLGATVDAVDFLKAQEGSTSAYASIAADFAAKVNKAALFTAANPTERDVTKLISGVTGVDTDAAAIAAAAAAATAAAEAKAAAAATAAATAAAAAAATAAAEAKAAAEKVAADAAAAAKTAADAAAATAAAEAKAAAEKVAADAAAAAKTAADAAAATAAAEAKAAAEKVAADAAAAAKAAADAALAAVDNTTYASEQAALDAANAAAATAAAAAKAEADAAAAKAAADLAAANATITSLQNPAGATTTLTSSSDVFVGVNGGNDTITGSEANIEGDVDVLVDGSSTDSDTLNLTATTFSSTLDTDGSVVRGIENVNVSFSAMVPVTFEADAIGSASTITVNQTRSGGTSTATVSDVYDGTTVIAGSGVNTLTVNTAADDYSLTVNGASATGTITADTTGSGSLVVTANSAGNINASSATGSLQITSTSATTIEADTTSGDITITASGVATVDADSTSAGDITVTAAASTDVHAATTGAGTVTLTAEGNIVDTVAKTANITVIGTDTTDTDITIKGVGTADSATLNLSDDAVVTNTAANAVETITVNATAASVVTVDTTGATTYVGNANTTFAGVVTMFDGKTVTGAATAKIVTTLDTADLTGVDTGTVIEVAASAASKTLTVNSGSTVKLSAAITTELTLNYNDGDDDVDSEEGVLNVILNKTSLTGGLTLDATGDTVSTLNLTVSAAPGTFVLTAGDTDVVATGSKALVLTNTSTAGSFNASAMTGAVSAETDSDFATLTTGSGADTITNGDTASVINTGSGNDSISDAGVGLASGKSINGGDGTDTLTVTATADFSAGTLSNIEYVDIDTGVTASVADAFVNGTSIAFTNDGVLAVKKITANLDLSNHTFSDSAHTVVVDYVTNKATTLGSTSATTITGSSVADTIDTHGGADTITAGSGNDDVDAGDGADTIYGQGGNDTLDGEGGADYIDGGAGNDTILGGDGADTIVAGAGEDVITGGALADSISLGADEESDDVILNEFATFDSISGFEAASDVIIVDFSALEALANDAVYLDDGASLTNETDAPAFNTIDGAADLGSATANSNILVIDGTIASASALETALETGGDFELKIEGGLGLGDIFLVLFSNGTDTFLAAVETTDTVADEAFIGAGDLTATVIAKLVGISDPTTLTAANFDYQA